MAQWHSLLFNIKRLNIHLSSAGETIHRSSLSGSTESQRPSPTFMKNTSLRLVNCDTEGNLLLPMNGVILQIPSNIEYLLNIMKGLYLVTGNLLPSTDVNYCIVNFSRVQTNWLENCKAVLPVNKSHRQERRQ